jgi:predicted Zn-dependent protease
MSGLPDNLGRTGASRRNRRALIALVAGLALGLTACASIDPLPAPASIAPTPVPRPVSAEKPNPERKRLIDAFGGVYLAPATQAYLDGVLAKIAPSSDASGPSYHVTVLNSPIVNAFSLPSGDIFVTRGLLALADDTSEIAAVMAHEIGHITARHAAQRAEFE